MKISLDLILTLILIYYLMKYILAKNLQNIFFLNNKNDNNKSKNHYNSLFDSLYFLIDLNIHIYRLYILIFEVNLIIFLFIILIKLKFYLV